jgi:membrane protein YqaA with SNARE-associated domain
MLPKIIRRNWKRVLGVTLASFFSFLFIFFMFPYIERYMIQYYSGAYNMLHQRLTNSFLDIVVISFITGLFFIQVPPEWTLAILGHGTRNLIVIAIAILIGIAIAHVFNYYCGYFLGRGFFKKLKLEYRIDNSNLPLFIYVFNALPLPSDVLAIVLGTLKVDFKIVITYGMLGQLTKYIAILITISAGRVFI